jgi:hypothetical protein
MGRADELRAELAVEELAERLVALKADPKVDAGSDEYRQAKEELRAARYRFRSLREAAPPEESVGDAVARPETIQARTSVKRPGGGSR